MAFEVEVECTGETDKAIFVICETGDRCTIPKSQITDDSEVWKAGQEGALVITDWIAGKLGLS